ncbi:MAG: thiamine diphosphokinase [Candidatus Onthomonas sp.]
MGEQVKRAILVGAAPGGDLSGVLALLHPGDYIICADGGLSKAKQLGLQPNWYVGDNDSGGSPVGLPSTLLPSEKDVSDLEMAVQQALHAGCRELILVGCSGGRADHYLANLGLLEQIHDLGGEGRLVDACNEIRFLSPGHYVVENHPRFHYLGLIPLDAQVSGVTLRGVKYPLSNFTLHRGSTRSISNEILPGQQAEITIERGRALLIRCQPETEERI